MNSRNHSTRQNIALLNRMNAMRRRIIFIGQRNVKESNNVN